MKIHEIEALLPITRANIRFYEKEGLLHPVRQENGYRTYSEEDCLRLKKIILFRKLGLSVADIRRILDGDVPLSQIVREQMLALQKEKERLEGSIGLCNAMMRDTSIDTDFSVEQYWKLMEQREATGENFLPYMEDYLKYEKNLFLNMWETTFLFPIRSIIRKRGWRIALLLIICICTIRGLSTQSVMKGCSFWAGFSYPLVVFGLLTLITLPLYLLNKKYEKISGTDSPGQTTSEDDKPGSPKQPQTVLSHLFKIAGLILYLAALLFGLPKLSDFWIEDLTGISQNYCVNYPLYWIYFGLGMYLLTLLVWLYSEFGVGGGIFSNLEGLKANLPNRAKTRVLTVSVLLFILGYLISFSCYSCISEEGASVRHLCFTKTYTWDDADYYTLRSSMDGTLLYTVVMKDNTRIPLLGGACGTMKFEKTKYPLEEVDFAVAVTKKFRQLGIPSRRTNWDQIQKRLSYDYWKYALARIRKSSAK